MSDVSWPFLTASAESATTESLVFGLRDEGVGAVVRAWLAARSSSFRAAGRADEVMASALRARPFLIVIDARGDVSGPGEVLLRLKGDSYTSVVPVVVLTGPTTGEITSMFSHGADEVLAEGISYEETGARLTALVARSERDTSVHPSTRLHGARAIEQEIARRLAQGDRFAACYADLDHFKEYNDRYSYYDGDRVIRLLARILHDIVKGTVGERGFVGHIGGDDFLFVVPAEHAAIICEEITGTFDLLVPLQYSEADRRVGYFFGKDRRGRLHRVPLMTVSIGVVSSERRHFPSAAEVAVRATEMKSYAKTLTGSVFALDRRVDSPAKSSGTIPSSSQSVEEER